ARFSGRLNEAGKHARLEHAEAFFEIGTWHLQRSQALSDLTFLESRPRRLRRAIGGIATMDKCGRFGGEDLLRLVQLGALQLGEFRDLVAGKLGEKLQEAIDVPVLAVPP